MHMALRGAQMLVVLPDLLLLAELHQKVVAGERSMKPVDAAVGAFVKVDLQEVGVCIGFVCLLNRVFADAVLV